MCMCSFLFFKAVYDCLLYAIVVFLLNMCVCLYAHLKSLCEWMCVCVSVVIGAPLGLPLCQAFSAALFA